MLVWYYNDAQMFMRTVNKENHFLSNTNQAKHESSSVQYFMLIHAHEDISLSLLPFKLF